MSDAETVDIDTRYKTVGELLETTRKLNNFLGSGDNARVYHFPQGIGLDDFVLRVRHRFSNKLLASTALSTLPEILVGLNMGQPLLYHGKSTDLYDLGILLRLEGHPIPKAASGKTAEDRCKNLHAILQKIIEKSGKNPFVDLLQQAISLEKAGHTPDFKIDNIMVKDNLSGLGLVDQLHCLNSHQIAAAFLPGELAFWELHLSQTIENYISTQGFVSSAPESDKILGLIHQAGRQLLQGYRTSGNDFIKPAPFAAPNGSAFSNIASTRAIRLDEPPHLLVERLKALKKFVMPPQR